MPEAPETKFPVAKFAWPKILRFKHDALLKRHKIFLLANAVASILLVSTGAAMHILHRGSLAAFCVNTIAIVPTSTLVSHSTKQLVVKLQQGEHEFLSGLINAIFGSFTELSFVIVCVVRNEPIVAQTALTGSLLSHTLLILGTCFFCGGLQNQTQSYSLVIAKVTSQLLLVSLASLIIPTAFRIFSDAGESGLVAISRGGAVMLLVIFGSYLYFWYYTHRRRHTIESLVESAASAALAPFRFGDINSTQQLLHLREAYLNKRSDKLSYIIHTAIMIISSFLMVLSSIFMLEAIQSPVHDIGVSKSFVGLIVVPVIIGAAEHVTTALRAQSRRKEEIEWIIEFAISSSIRTTLFILPLAVILGWILNSPGITLFFDGFQVTLLSLAILLVNYVVHGGMAHWLEGVMLIGAYVLFANAAWRYPNEA